MDRALNAPLAETPPIAPALAAQIMGQPQPPPSHAGLPTPPPGPLSRALPGGVPEDIGRRAPPPPPREYAQEKPPGGAQPAAARTGQTSLAPRPPAPPVSRFAAGRGAPGAPKGPRAPTRDEELTRDILEVRKRDLGRMQGEVDTVRREVDLQQQERDNEIALREQTAEYQRQMLDEQRAEADRVERDTKAMMDDWQAEEEKANAMKVDPDRYWSGEGGGVRKALAILGAAIYGGILAQTNPGARNPLLDRMDEAVDRDIRLQEQEIERARGKATRKRTRLQDYTERFGSPEAARSALKGAMIGQFEREAAIAAAKTQNPIAKQRAENAAEAFKGAKLAEWDKAIAARSAAELQAREEERRRRAAAMAAGSARTGISKEERAAREKDAIDAEKRTRVFEDAARDYTRWLRSPPKNAEERVQANEASQRYRSLYRNGVLQRVDAPSKEETQALEDTLPGSSPGLVERWTPEALRGVLPEAIAPAGAREGAAKTTESALAQLRREEAEAKARRDEARARK